MKNIWRIRAVDMCIYIDEHIYDKYNEELVFGYLQWLFYSLSIKKKYFKNFDDYESYALYGATQTYLRLTDKRQFLPENNPKKLKKIKSVLNFIKRIMYPLKVNYQKNTFNDVIKIAEESEYDGSDAYNGTRENLIQQVISDNSAFLQCDISSYLKTLNRIIKKVVNDTPYKNDSVMTHRLYISCLITVLKSVTLSNENKEKLFENDRLKLVSQNYINNVYQKELEDSITCWRLPEEYNSYVNILAIRVRKLAAEDIKSLIHDYEPSENIIQDILMAPVAELNEDNE